MSLQSRYLAYSCTIIFLCLGVANPTECRSEMQRAEQGSSLEAAVRLLVQEAKSSKPPTYPVDRPKPSKKLQRIQQDLVIEGLVAVPLLILLLVDPDLRVSEAAADILQRIPDTKAQDAVIAYSLSHLLDQPRRTKWLEGPGYRRLMEIGMAALPAITQAYDQRETRREGAYLVTLLEVASTMPRHAGLPLIKRALLHPCATIASVAVTNLSLIEGQRAFPLLVDFLGYRETDCIESQGGLDRCVSGVRALANLKNPDAVEPLLNLFIRLGPEPPNDDWRNLNWNRPTCQHEVIAAIDQLTGQQMKGNTQRIRAWVEIQKHLPTPSH